jgi:hypothetical protein
MARVALLALLAVVAVTALPSRAEAQSASPSDDSGVGLASSPHDVAAEQRAGMQMRQTWRDYRPRVPVEDQDLTWAWRRYRRSYVAKFWGVELMIAGVGSSLLGMMTGFVVPDAGVHLGFSIATTGLLGLGGACLLGGATYVRQVHRQFGTGPLWAGRITGIVLLGLALGSGAAAIIGSAVEMDTLLWSPVPAAGQALGLYLGMSALIVLAVDVNRHRRPLGVLRVPEGERGGGRRGRPGAAVLPVVVPTRDGASVALVGSW